MSATRPSEAELAAMAERARNCDAEGRPAEAAELYAALAVHFPQAWAVHNNLGTALRALNRPEEAAAALQRATELGGEAESWSNLGLALGDLYRWEEARAAHARVLALKPDAPMVRINAATQLIHCNDFAPAEKHLRAAVDLAPGQPLPLFKLGAMLCRANRYEEAVPLLRQVLAQAPRWAEAHLYLGAALLALGDLAAGFAEYEWRRGMGHMIRMPDPAKEWQGGMLEGRRVLLYCEQGLGDTLQFCRYAAVAAAVGGKVTLLVQPALARLMRTVPGVTDVVDSPESLPPHDCHLPLMSMARLVGTRLDTIPTPIPYVRAEESQVEQWRQRLAALPGLKVGLVWSGAPRAHDRDAYLTDLQRSLPLASLAPLAGIPGLSLVSLQMGTAADQLRASPHGLTLYDPMAEIGDFADTAALIQALDLVISVDTSVAHLAGALGKPVWVLSRFNACWRWMRNRPDSPWYPSLRVFGQPTPGDWATPMGEVAAQLRALSGQRKI
jgi:Flp pilus assembly protein TadD